jgi:hypothetical protein
VDNPHRNPEGYSPRYWKRHPERIPKIPANNEPNKNKLFTTRELWLFAFLSIFAAELGIASLDMYPLWLNVVLYLAGLVFIELCMEVGEIHRLEVTISNIHVVLRGSGLCLSVSLFGTEAIRAGK